MDLLSSLLKRPVREVKLPLKGVSASSSASALASSSSSPSAKVGAQWSIQPFVPNALRSSGHSSSSKVDHKKVQRNDYERQKKEKAMDPAKKKQLIAKLRAANRGDTNLCDLKQSLQQMLPSEPSSVSSVLPHSSGSSLRRSPPSDSPSSFSYYPRPARCPPPPSAPRTQGAQKSQSLRPSNLNRPRHSHSSEQSLPHPSNDRHPRHQSSAGHSSHKRSSHHQESGGRESSNRINTRDSHSSSDQSFRHSTSRGSHTTFPSSSGSNKSNVPCNTPSGVHATSNSRSELLPRKPLRPRIAAPLFSNSNCSAASKSPREATRNRAIADNPNRSHEYADQVKKPERPAAPLPPINSVQIKSRGTTKVRKICGVPQPIKRKMPEFTSFPEKGASDTRSYSYLERRGVRGGVGAVGEEYDRRSGSKYYPPPSLRRPPPRHDYYDDLDEMDEEDLAFIDDGPLEDNNDWRQALRGITGYDPTKYKGKVEECTETSFDRQFIEEKFSSKEAAKEDAEQLKLIQAEEEELSRKRRRR